MTGLQGVHAAAITPRASSGELDFGAAFELIDHLCRGGVTGILLFGPAGEPAAFAPVERARLTYLAVKRSRVPVLVSVAAATMEAALDLAREARDAGAAGLVLPPPRCSRCDQEDLLAWFDHFADEAGSDPPVFVYRAGALAPESAAALWTTGRFAGVIEPEDGCAAEALLSAGATLLDGDELLATRPSPRPVISAAACALPEVVVALHRAIARGAGSDAALLLEEFREFMRWRARFPEPRAVQVATGLRGVKTGPPAMPLSPRKQAELDAFREWFQCWLPAVRKIAAHA